MMARSGPFSTSWTESALSRLVMTCFEVGIDVPRVVIFRRVLEGLQLVAAAASGDGFEFRCFVEEARDAASLRIDRDAKQRVFQRQAAGLQIGGAADREPGTTCRTS